MRGLRVRVQARRRKTQRKLRLRQNGLQATDVEVRRRHSHVGLNWLGRCELGGCKVRQLGCEEDDAVVVLLQSLLARLHGLGLLILRLHQELPLGHELPTALAVGLPSLLQESVAPIPKRRCDYFVLLVDLCLELVFELLQLFCDTLVLIDRPA